MMRIGVACRFMAKRPTVFARPCRVEPCELGRQQSDAVKATLTKTFVGAPARMCSNH